MIERQSTAPFGVLTIISSLFATRLAALGEMPSGLRPSDIPSFLGLILSFTVIVIILCMPLRSPALPKHEICAPYQTPTHHLRSPEDDLTLWQFMTVSWMSPLIKIGSSKQLNEEDVWSLSFEFQHKGLHEKFRLLKGSVVKRLLIANGLDLIIMTMLAILECLASEYHQTFFPWVRC